MFWIGASRHHLPLCSYVSRGTISPLPLIGFPIPFNQHRIINISPEGIFYSPKVFDHLIGTEQDGDHATLHQGRM